MEFTYRLCQKLTKVRPNWFNHPNHKQFNQLGRERLAYRLFVETSKADLGAIRSSHWRDIDRMALFDRLLRSDMLPARALEYLED